MAVVAAWAGVGVGVLALAVACIALRRDRRTDERQQMLEVLQARQAADVEELVKFERLRAARQRERDERMAEARAGAQAAALEANLVVVGLQPREAIGARYIAVRNEGPHDAVLRSLIVRLSVVTSTVVDKDRGPVELPAGADPWRAEVPMVASGDAQVDLVWTDGRADDQSATISVNMPERPPLHPPAGGSGPYR